MWSTSENWGHIKNISTCKLLPTSLGTGLPLQRSTIAKTLLKSSPGIRVMVRVRIFRGKLIIRILLVKLVKLFSMFFHIICYQMDFWWIKVFIMILSIVSMIYLRWLIFVIADRNLIVSFATLPYCLILWGLNKLQMWVVLIIVRPYVLYI